MCTPNPTETLERFVWKCKNSISISLHFLLSKHIFITIPRNIATELFKEKRVSKYALSSMFQKHKSDVIFLVYVIFAFSKFENILISFNIQLKPSLVFHKLRFRGAYLWPGSANFWEEFKYTKIGAWSRAASRPNWQQCDPVDNSSSTLWERQPVYSWKIQEYSSKLVCTQFLFRTPRFLKQKYL